MKLLVDKTVRLFFLLFFIFIIFFSLTTNLPLRQRGGFFSDEASYFSITQSLVHDFDLKYTPQDSKRITKDFPAGPVGLHLKRAEDGEIYYAKSFAYPMAAAPFFALFGVRGFLLFNGLMIFFAIFMAYHLLARFHPSKNSLSFALIFVLASVVPVYLWWMTADLFNFFTMFTGLFFFFYPFKRPGLFYLSGVFFSFAVFSKPWIAVAISIIYLVLIFRKQWKKFVILSLISIAVFGGFVFFYYAQTGTISYKLYQGGERRQFSPLVLYQHPGVTFEDGILMSFDNYWDRIYLSPRIIANNLFYFLFGRFTGMFIYFASAFFILVLFFFQRKEPEDWFVLAAILAGSLMFLVLAADNYFGGSGSVGNRYFFTVFPIFFFLGFKNRIFKFSIVPVIISLVLLSGVYLDSHYHSTTPRLAGISYPINLFPPEKTQYLSLPTNENHRAFGQRIHVGDKTYQIFFLNDNFHTIENNAFWSKADNKTELFLVTTEKVKTFEVTLVTKKENNTVYFSIENRSRHLKLNPGKSYTVNFKHIHGLQMNKNRFIYHVKIKSSRSYTGYMDNPQQDPDRRELGVKTHIGVVF